MAKGCKAKDMHSSLSLLFKLCTKADALPQHHHLGYMQIIMSLSSGHSVQVFQSTDILIGVECRLTEVSAHSRCIALIQQRHCQYILMIMAGPP